MRVSIVDKAISANIGALSGLDFLTHLDLRNCSRVGGAPIVFIVIGRVFLALPRFY